MFQVNATLAIILSFLLTFVDELGEIGEISQRKVLLICVAVGASIIFYLNAGQPVSSDANLSNASVSLSKMHSGISKFLPNNKPAHTVAAVASGPSAVKASEQNDHKRLKH